MTSYKKKVYLGKLEHSQRIVDAGTTDSWRPTQKTRFLLKSPNQESINLNKKDQIFKKEVFLCTLTSVVTKQNTQ